MIAILLSAGVGERTRGQGPCPLFSIGEKTLLDYQIESLKPLKCDVLTVLGFSSNKVFAKVQSDFYYIENEQFDTTTSAESLRLALKETDENEVLVIDGNCLFNRRTIKLDYSESFVLYGKRKKGKLSITHNDYLENISYGLMNSWNGISFFKGEVLAALRQRLEEKRGLLLYEYINSICNRNIRAYEREVLEINNFRKQRYEILDFIKNR